MGLTLCAHATGAVLHGMTFALAHLAPVARGRGVTLPPSLPLTLSAAQGPLAPLLPAAVHCTLEGKNTKFKDVLKF